MEDRTSNEKNRTVVPCVYFQDPGKENTQQTLEIASRRVTELDVSSVIVASISGKTGSLATQLFPGRNLVIVSHSAGFLKPDFQQLIPEERHRIEDAGAKVLTCQHALGGVGRAVRKKLGTYELEEIMAFTLRVFGQGTKVAIEIALMAADAGLISTKIPCMSIGGTEQGADTAILLIPANAQNFFDLRVLEILAKPRLN